MRGLHGGDRFGADAVGHPGDQKHDHDEENQAGHERRVADEGARSRIAERRGAARPGRTSTTTMPTRATSAVQQPARFLGRQALPFFRQARPVFAEPWLDDPIRDESAYGDQQHARRDAEIKIGGQLDRLAGVNDVGRVIGHFGEDAVDRLDKEIDAERGRDPGERRGQTGQRMTAEAMKGGRPRGIRTR